MQEVPPRPQKSSYVGQSFGHFLAAYPFVWNEISHETPNHNRAANRAVVAELMWGLASTHIIPHPPNLLTPPRGP